MRAAVWLAGFVIGGALLWRRLKQGPRVDVWQQEWDANDFWDVPDDIRHLERLAWRNEQGENHVQEG